MLGSRISCRTRRLVVALLVTALGAGTAGPVSAQELEIPPDPEEVLELVLHLLDAVVPDDLPDPVALLDPLNPTCDTLDPGQCLFPFPSDHWTVADPSTATGRRVDLPLLAMPRNLYAKPVDPAEWNRSDGFSPGSMLLTYVPGLDLVRTWGLHDRPARYQAQITDLALSLAPDAPIVIVDADTGERHPFFSELDGHEDTPAGARTLIIRPAVNFREGHRYVVGLRNLRNSRGEVVPAQPTFAALRSGRSGGTRGAHYDREVFPALAAAGVEREDLYLAWDFTIASADSLAGRALHIRDETFAALGDTDLADGVVEGRSPAFHVDSVEVRDDPEDATARVVRGTVTVPNYLTLPDELTVEVPEVGTFPLPASRFAYATLTPGPHTMPRVNPLDPTRAVEFVCSVPRSALAGAPAVPTLYGHGLLGSKDESTGGSTDALRQNGYMPCAVDWAGMATGDLLNVATILQDVSLFPSLADRAQQGFLDFLVLGRALSHPDGLVTAGAFRGRDGRPLFDPAGLVYDGNSQGAIMGGSLTALGVDFTRAVLGVPGMNYSTLLNRSVDWEGAYGELLYAFYPNKRTQQLMFALIQMLWDRGEANGYAQHLAADPLPGTPAKQVLLQAGYSDHQVSNVAAEVEARTFGARRISSDLPVCRHWAVDPMFGFEENDPAVAEAGVLAYFDSGTPRAPNDNTPSARGEDPHGDPRHDPAAVRQKVHFYETGRVIDVAEGGHARTDVWPEAAGRYRREVEADLAAGCLDFLAPAGPVTPPAEPPVPDDPAGGSGRLPATGAPVAGGLAVALLVAAVALRAITRRSRPLRDPVR